MKKGPADVVKDIERVFPGVWRKIDQMQPVGAPPGVFLKSKNLTKVVKKSDFPDFLSVSELFNSPDFMPAYLKMLSEGCKPDDCQRIHDAGEVIAVASWRATKIVYDFDVDFSRELVDTPLTGAPPSSFFDHLPVPAFFVNLPPEAFPEKYRNLIDNAAYSFGFFVARSGDNLFFYKPGIRSFKFDLSNYKDIQSYLDESIGELGRCLNVKDRDGVSLVDSNDFILEANLAYWKTAMNALLYLCAQEPDIDALDYPKAKRTPMGSYVRTLEAKKETVATVGRRLGSVFRHERSGREAHDASESTGISMPTYIRRAHWHTYWTGPRDNRVPTLKWLNLIVVNASIDGELDEVVHPVKRERMRG